MEEWFLWSLVPIIVVLFYLAFRYLLRWITSILGKYYPSRAVHLILLTRNSQRRVEWSVWSYHLWNSFRRRKAKITCIDAGSTDDTLAILDRLRSRYLELEVIRMQDDRGSLAEDSIQAWLYRQRKEREKQVVLDLREGEVRGESGRNLA